METWIRARVDVYLRHGGKTSRRATVSRLIAVLEDIRQHEQGVRLPPQVGVGDIYTAIGPARDTFPSGRDRTIGMRCGCCGSYWTGLAYRPVLRYHQILILMVQNRISIWKSCKQSGRSTKAGLPRR